LKFLALFGGIMAANAEYPCIWCTSKNSEFYDHTREWRIDNRNIANATRDRNKFGFKQMPISLSIPYHMYIPDTLHLFLRISDKLFFIRNEEFLLDDIDRDKPHNANILNFPQYRAFLTFLNEANVRRTLADPEAETQSKPKLRSFRGPEYIRIYKTIKLNHFLQFLGNKNINKATNIFNLLKNFYNIYCNVCSNDISFDFEANEIENETKNWLKLFLTIYPRNKVTLWRINKIKVELRP
jgi:hypothetical protein